MDEQKTQPIATPLSESQADAEQRDAQYEPAQDARYIADTQVIPQRQAAGGDAYSTAQYPTQYPTAQYQPQYSDAQYPPQRGEQPAGPIRHKRWPLVVAVIVVVAIVAGTAGFLAYRNKHDQALADCRNAVSEFTAARKELLDTGESSTQVQQLLRSVLGVDDILDAAADASSQAERTVGTEGCAANATITQLNLVKDTVSSATASLRKSIGTITKEAGKLGADSSSKNNAGNDSSSSNGNGTDGNNGNDSDNSDNADSDDSGSSKALEQGRQDLQNTIDSARGLLDQLKNSELNSTLKQLASSALSKGLDAAQNLANDPNVRDSHAYETAKATLEQAIDAARQWLSSQAGE
ncbi:hypothetical protein G1C98_1338 [Bifidobacterium sp. DSM 109960]|uniref:M-like protein Szp3 n=1 Tax=Bifidobacterium erythrocebi TaxID=2675325 RepID=A0A7Y0HVT9_9BIFI|nr:hypothetical protein [Bifidobacterium sp. DSM 109960]NMM96602.1 hypothetical protein [Bifidobacterium sp. DSM 109960]